MIGPRRSPLVGRAAELAALQRAAAQARGGHGGLVLVHGEAGVGKSRLCREVTASLHDALHLRGQAFPGDDIVAHGILVDTLRAARRDTSSQLWATAQRHASALGAVVPELLSDEHATVQFDDETRLFEVVLDVIEEVATGRLVVWLVEDIQWADVATWRFLHYCSRRAPSMRLLVLASFRDDERPPHDPAWTRLVVPGSREGVAVLSLQRLSPQDTELLVRDVCGSTLDDDTVHSIVDRSGGTPLLVEELIAAREAVGTKRESVPDVVRVTAQERARKAGDDARALLDLAAVMGHDTDLELLVDLRPDQAASVERLVDAGLLRPAAETLGSGVEFRHPMLREAVYEAIPWERRRRLHAEAAAALMDHASVQSVERVARHWELAGRPDEALGCLLDVIAAAHRQENLPRACALGLLALALIERHPRLRPQRDALVTPLIDDLFLTGEWRPLEPLLREALHSTPRGNPRRLHLAALFAQSEAVSMGSAMAEADQVVHEELVTVGDSVNPDVALLLYTAGMRAWMDLDVTAAERFAEQAAAVAAACGVLDIELRVRSLKGWVDITKGVNHNEVRAYLLEGATRARAAHLGPREASLLLQVARLSLDAEDIRQAEAAGRVSARWYEIGARILRGFVSAFSGRGDEAVRAFDELPLTETGAKAEWTALIGRSLVHLMQGRPAQARRHAATMSDMPSLVPNMGCDTSSLVGWALWEEGDLAAAAATFADTLQVVANSRLEPMVGPYFIALQVDALMRLGRTDEATALLTEWTPREDRPDADRYTRAGFAAARLRHRPSVETLAAAVAACQQADWPWLEGLCRAWAVELLGDMASANQARMLWRRIGYQLGVSQLEDLLARNGHAATRPAPARRLTPREEHVADLIAEGLTNAQIAQRLGISAVTVAHHVSSVLNKLGVASRTQVAVLRARGDG